MCKKSQLSYGYPMVMVWVSYGTITIVSRICTYFMRIREYEQAQKKRPYSFFTRENFQRIGFEACFFLCNPATSSLPGD